LGQRMNAKPGTHVIKAHTSFSDEDPPHRRG
jgi:hypothetical protein